MLETIGWTKADFEDEKVSSSDGGAKRSIMFQLHSLVCWSDCHFLEYQSNGCTFGGW